MTIREAITRADAIEPNTFTEEEKVKWLSYLDGDLLLETVLSHETDDDPPNTFYTLNDMDVVLLAPYPHDEMYVYYLEMKVAESLDEMARYNNLVSQFNSIYQDYVRYYHRTHKPLSTPMKFR